MYKIPSYLPRSHFIRPQQTINKLTALEKFVGSIFSFPALLWVSRLRPYKTMLPIVHAYDGICADYDDAQLKTHARYLGRKLRQNGFSTNLVAETFSLVREAAGRSLGLYHFDSQLIGGLALFYGHVAEMQTGEGKTLTATLPAATAALAGVPVHVITVNDYLAKRDAEEMLPVYQLLGLSVGCVVQGMSLDERKLAYSCDVVYCTNNELVFDYLKDQIALKSNKSSLKLHSERLKGNNNAASDVMLKGLHYAIVDEADSVFMDEATTPLIISATVKGNDEEAGVYRQAIDIASSFIEGQDFTLDRASRKVSLTPQGEERARKLSEDFGPFWSGRVRRLELVSNALSAICLFERDHHYLLRDGKIEIIDEHTGRVMPDRSWEKGLHQLIEIKEGCEISPPRETLEKISYQRFFRMYHHLAGMTGTAAEVRSELWSIYKLPVVTIPTHKPSRRSNVGVQLCKTSEAKWMAVVSSLETHFAQGRSVLVGTGSVATSELLSEKLKAHNIPHKLLNAKQDALEAEVIANAGQSGQITIATSMAGRGTDIKIDETCASAGGLHVLLTELHDSSRIDRQLEGRCARMGDCGSTETIVAVDDPIMKNNSNAIWKLLSLLRFSESLNNKLGFWMMKRVQKSIEKNHERVRAQLLKYDEHKDELLAFSGKSL
jgi:preprotein translocase subunit SecA